MFLLSLRRPVQLVGKRPRSVPNRLVGGAAFCQTGPPRWSVPVCSLLGLLDGKRSITYDLGSAFTPPCGNLAAAPCRPRRVDRVATP